VSGGFDGATHVAMVDADPDLAAGVPDDELYAARRRSQARTVTLTPPHWDPGPLVSQADPGWLGLFVLDGVLIRRVTVGKRSACELFGAGDLVRPWDSDGEYEPLSISVSWLVLEETRLAVLDTAFVLRLARWPSINGRLVSRVAQRARYLALTQAITHLPQASARLLILFWLLAERWGRIGPAGVVITLPLTHEVLAMLIGAQRPTVTIGLQRLMRARYLIRERSNRWLLTNKAIECLRDPESLRLVDGIEPKSQADPS
jgi:CRP-like cAMP-binding protein